jgi:protein-L-isoaspartate O-methyltransferase
MLTRRATTLTALDSSAAMLERNRREVADPRVVYVHADIFEWAPERSYDLVFFGFWLSHVPPATFEQFWSLVRSSLAPGGRVAFVDEDDRASGVVDDIQLVGGVPVARRVLADGRHLDVVKVFWNAAELEDRLKGLGWDINVTRFREMQLYGEGRNSLA